MASWATRTPAIRDILSISTAEMGAVLFGLSIGSMSGILCSAWLVKRFGTRKVIRTTMSCAVLGMAILSVALWLHSAITLSRYDLAYLAPALVRQKLPSTSKVRQLSAK